jgi:N-acetylneuraminic acid mutarotase
VFFGIALVVLVPAFSTGPRASAALGSWTTKHSLPTPILDAGGRQLGTSLYFVAGKTSTSHLRTMYTYSPATDSWSNAPQLPAAYPAVENPAVATYRGRLYVFGGSTAAFSGAVSSAAVYDRQTRSWTMLRPMPSARGGATAQAIGTKIYVVGGMDGNGASLASMLIYTPATNRWSLGPSMAARRDNPGSAVLGLRRIWRLFVFGGRTRDADGTTLNGTLASVEMYTPATNRWRARAPMPTGRRTMVVGRLHRRAQLMGGEKSTTGAGTFPQNEEYLPRANTWRSLSPMLTPRHGAVAGTIAGVVYVAGGGPKGGSSYSAITEAFIY